MLDAPVVRDSSSDCIRDLISQCPLSTLDTRIGAESPSPTGSSGLSSHAPQNASCLLSGILVQDMLTQPHPAYVFAVDNLAVPGVTCTREIGRKDSMISVPVPLRLGRPTIVIPEVGFPCGKYGDFSSSSMVAEVASPISVQSSVSGEESSLARRTSPEVDGNGASNSRSVARTCAHCGTVKTPLWRNGPQGPKSLCNACGIRFKKESKRTLSCGNSPGLLGSLACSPVSVKVSPSKSSKRKNWWSVSASRSRQYWSAEAARKFIGSEPSPKTWKRNRLPVARGFVESSGSEAEEAVRSSGTSCVTWHARANSPVCTIPKLAMPLLGAGPSSNLSGFLSMGESSFAEQNRSKSAPQRKMSFAQDEEEGAMLLMALSCGLVNV